MQRSLHILAASARTLGSAQPLAARVQQLFTLLREVVLFRDARLTCWLQSARPGALRQQFYARDGSPYPWDEALMRQVALSQQVRRQELVLGSTPRSKTIARPGDYLPAVQASYLGAPVLWSGRLWGVLELRAPYNARPLVDEAALELVLALLPQLAAAVAEEGARLPNRAEQPLATHTQPLAAALPPGAAQALDALEQELEGLPALHALLDMALRCAMDVTGAEAGAAATVDRERGELVLHAHEGYGPQAAVALSLEGGPPQRWSWNVGIAGRVARTGRAALLRDVATDPDYRPGQLYPWSASRAELAAPISEGDGTLAVLVLDSPRSAAFDEGALAFVNALCERVARPLRRAQRYQEALETSTQLSQVFSGLPTGLALLDLNGRVLRANPAWARVWGMPEPVSRPSDLERSSSITRPLAAIPQLAASGAFHVPIDLVEALLPRLAEPLKLTEFCGELQHAPGEPKTLDLRLLNPTQELLVLSVPTRDSVGQLTGRLWAVSDVTREREVDRLKNEFVSVVSHELRTPLTSILGYTELLLARDFPLDERRQFIQTVYDQAQNLSQLVEDLLNASRIDAGQIKLTRWVIGLRQVVNELTKQLNAELGELARHRLVIDLREPLPPVNVDRDKVRQVLFNLLTNAIKYSPTGGEIALRAIEARQPMREADAAPRERGSTPTHNHTPPPSGSPFGTLPPDHPPGRWLVVSVSDQGMGIAPEDLPRIWERFYRVDNTNTRRIGGTGLGLAITKALVELHGGRIWAQSEVQHGSVFCFTLPVAADVARRG